MIFVDYSALDNCKNIEASYGEICVKCNRCGRFSQRQNDETTKKVDEIFKEVFGDGEDNGNI